MGKTNRNAIAKARPNAKPAPNAADRSGAASSRLEVDPSAVREALIKRLEEIAEPVCRANGVELVAITHGREPGGAVVRVLLDTQTNSAPGSGVTLDDCTNVSRDLSTAFDVHEPIAGAYRLEVSSPGLERPLVKLADFTRFAGREVRIKTKSAIADRRSFHGTLIGIGPAAGSPSSETPEESADRPTTILIEQDGARVSIPFGEIAKANLVHRFERG